MHALSEFGELRRRALAPEKVATQFRLELLDGAGQRRLGDVALIGPAREIQRPADRHEIADLMHFHELALPQ